ncbi:MAG: twin-arginine translocation signal domain-containing protein, partial [Clostridia bacterium]|nr:twin-arginine translocation signal domain-containing protein [Clostridia bacterium]
MGNISRRDFLKGSVAGAAALAAGGLIGTVTEKECVAFAEEAAPAAAAASPVLPWTELNPQDESYTKRTTDYSAIFSPIQIGNVTLKNRII